MLESQNKALKNDGNDELDHSHFALQKSKADINSILSPLFSILESALNIFFQES